jgi:hypothetical protein
VNVFERINAETEAETAEKWRKHVPLTVEQAEGLNDLLDYVSDSGYEQGQQRRTYPVNAGSPGTGWRKTLILKRPTERMAVINVKRDVMASAVWIRVRYWDGYLEIINPQGRVTNIVLLPQQTKRCPRCAEHKPTYEFYTNNSRKDGLDGYCMVCRAEIQVEYAEERRRRKAA